MRVLGPGLLSATALVLIVACESEEPLPSPAAPAGVQATSANAPPSAIPRAPAAAKANPESDNAACCGAAMCRSVSGGCGCRKANPNANCGG